MTTEQFATLKRGDKVYYLKPDLKVREVTIERVEGAKATFNDEPRGYFKIPQTGVVTPERFWLTRAEANTARKAAVAAQELARQRREQKEALLPRLREAGVLSANLECGEVSVRLSLEDALLLLQALKTARGLQ